MAVKTMSSNRIQTIDLNKLSKTNLQILFIDVISKVLQALCF